MSPTGRRSRIGIPSSGTDRREAYASGAFFRDRFDPKVNEGAMNPDAVARKLADMAKKIEADKGPLDLLGLFLTDNTLGLWDVVIAAPWLEAHVRPSFEYVAKHLQSTLVEDEMM